MPLHQVHSQLEASTASLETVSAEPEASTVKATKTRRKAKVTKAAETSSDASEST